MSANSKTLLQVVFTAISGLIMGLVIALLAGLIPGEAQAANDPVAETSSAEAEITAPEFEMRLKVTSVALGVRA